MGCQSGDPNTNPHDEIAALTANFLGDTVLEQTLASVTTAAVELVDGVDYADVMIVDHGRSWSLTPTVALLKELDAVQIRLQEGPCLQTARHGAMIRCTDLREDSRWPRFAAAAVAAGVHSMLSFQLHTPCDGLGALNLFGRAPRRIDPSAEAIGALLAALATAAMTTADRHQQFRAALDSRDLIGQAKDILMNQYTIDAERAFDMLRKLSQDSNTPLRTIAQQNVDTL